MKNTKPIYRNGSEYWYNEKEQLHRSNNLPAIIHNNGGKSYCINGANHRINGPAFIWEYGYGAYYINGIKQNNPDKETLWICNKVEIL